MARQTRTRSARGKLTQGTLLNRMTNRLSQSLELQEILSCTVQEMRSFLGTDRVKVYRFHSDGAGQVIAESVDQNRLPSLLNLHFPAGDIPPHAREMFVKAHQRSIVDVSQQRITLSRSDCLGTTGDLTVEEVHERAIEDIIQRPVDPCHVEYLTAMGVQSSLVVPILHHQELWGLLVSHHSKPKTFNEKDLQIVQIIADQVSIAIAQSDLLTQTREKAHREALINKISTLLHSPLKSQEILKIVLEQVILAVEGSGGRLYLPSIGANPAQLYSYGTQPALPVSDKQALLEDYPFWQQLMTCEYQSAKHVNSSPNLAELVISVDNNENPVTNLQVITDIYQSPQLLGVASAFRSTNIRSMLVMPLQYGGNYLGCLSIFRDEIDTDILWAGRFEPDERNSRVRDSFEAWRELRLGQPHKWTDEEIELVHSLRTHLTMAVMQNRLYEYEREQRTLVEMRNCELKAARAAADEANRLKSDFLSSCSHELRTPLTSTLNYLTLLEQGFYDNPQELQEYIKVAHESAQDLVAIINNVLDIAKIEAGHMHVNSESVSLPSLLERKRKLFSLESRNKGIPLIIECSVDNFFADKLKLRQILTNLLSNAFKFTSLGSVRIRAGLSQVRAPTASDHPLVEISVADTGIGIDNSKRDLLFEPFVQADGSIKRRYGGTGLGLTICQRLVELMGGNIWLDSPGIGQGTTVTFTFINSEVKVFSRP